MEEEEHTLSDDDISKGSDSYDRKKKRHEGGICVSQPKNTVQLSTKTLVAFGCFCTVIGFITSSLIFRPTICDCGTKYLQNDDIHVKLEEIMKSVREEKNVKLQLDRNRCDSAKTLPKPRWLPRQILADVKKHNLMRNVLRKEQRRLALEYAETKKKRMGYARKIMLKGLICDDLFNPLYQYDCVYGNKRLDIDGTETLKVSLWLELTPAVFSDGDLLFEFGLVYGKDDHQRKQIPGITGYRCKRKSGVCLELFGKDLNELSKNEADSKLVESQFSFKLHQQNILFIKDNILQSIFRIESDKRNVLLYPACAVYNPHLAKVSVSIAANTNTIFNITSIDNHMFVSDDNKTISNLPIVLRDKWLNIIKYAHVLVIIIVLALLILTVKNITLRPFENVVHLLNHVKFPIPRTRSTPNAKHDPTKDETRFGDTLRTNSSSDEDLKKFFLKEGKITQLTPRRKFPIPRRRSKRDAKHDPTKDETQFVDTLRTNPSSDDHEDLIKRVIEEEEKIAQLSPGRKVFIT